MAKQIAQAFRAIGRKAGPGRQETSRKQEKAFSMLCMD